MASEFKTSTSTVVPLNGSNYPTWKLQCRMALMKDGLWNIVNGTEEAPAETDLADRRAKYATRKDRALAIIVLSIEPSLLYLIEDPDDPIEVWRKLADQFQKKTWANKLSLRRKLYSLRLKEGNSIQDHIKAMTEVFDELSVIGDAIEEEDRVVYLLASLPKSYNILVTALEANPEVPKLEVVTERLLHEEQKLKDRLGTRQSNEEALLMKNRTRRRGPRCHRCRKFGHIQRDCTERSQYEKKPDTNNRVFSKHKLHNTEVKYRKDCGSDSDVALVVSHALSVGEMNQVNRWIIDSGATCHICNDREAFTELHELKKPMEVALGDGHTLEAPGRGIVAIQLLLPNEVIKRCMLQDVLYVPELSYNLLSVPKVTDTIKKVKFDETNCQILDADQKVVAIGTKSGSLYYLDCLSEQQQINVTKDERRMSHEDVWHRRFAHLGLHGLQRLVNEKLVDGFNYDKSKNINFCDSCVEGKLHRSQFPMNGGRRSEEILGLVHSDVCGKINEQSLGGGQYFLTFIDDKSRYVWVYILKHKSEVYEKFLEWKAMVEKVTDSKLKVLRTDNGGIYL